MLKILLIALGGAAGSLLRFGVTGWVHHGRIIGFPLGTLVVNVAGCAAIGFLASLFRGPLLIREEYQFAIVVGVLGGFTTFSTFAWESVNLANQRQFALALLNVLLSNVLGLSAAWAGSQLSRALYNA